MVAKDIAREVATLAGISIPEANKVVRAVGKIITQALQNKETVQVRGFGTFRVQYCPPRRYMTFKRHRQIGIAISAPRHRVFFRPATEFIALLYYDYKGTP